jgi:hypothetical protein
MLLSLDAGVYLITGDLCIFSIDMKLPDEALETNQHMVSASVREIEANIPDVTRRGDGVQSPFPENVLYGNGCCSEFWEEVCGSSFAEIFGHKVV